MQESIRVLRSVFVNPTDEQTTAHHYRIKAEELRTMAAEDLNPRTRDALFNVAEEYERMARTMETIDRTNKKIRKLRN
jgi:hypothetical protein